MRTQPPKYTRQLEWYVKVFYDKQESIRVWFRNDEKSRGAYVGGDKIALVT